MARSGSEPSHVPLPARIAAVLAAARCGDRQAVAGLLACCEPVIEPRVCHGLAAEGDAGEAEDLLQTIRLAIVENLPRLRSDDPGSFLSWLEKLVRSRIADWKRGRRRRMPEAAGLGGECAPEPVAPTTTPSRIVMREEERERFLRAIESVPGRYRPVLRRIVGDDPGPGELAAFLGKGPEAARKFTERALAHLAGALRAAAGPGTRRIRTRSRKS